MPLIDVTYPAGALAADAREELAGELTTVLLRAERAPDTEFFHNLTWIHLHELPEEAVRAAGRPVPEPVFRLDVSVPEGALSDRRKQELVSEATKAVLAAAGLGEGDALRVWVLIREVPDGNWGAAGQVVRFQALREAAAHEREKAAEAVPETA